MNLEDTNYERYSRFFCLHVKSASMFIGGFHLTAALLFVFQNLVYYGVREISNDDFTRNVFSNSRSVPSALCYIVYYLINAVASAMLIYGLIKNRPSFLMPFFGMQLYNFFFILPSSLSILHSTNQSQYSNSNEPPMKITISNGYPDHTYILIYRLIDFLVHAYCICVIWKCYRYLRMKELVIPLHMPYNLRGVEIIVPPDKNTPLISMDPPDYETATKSNPPPPDYESALMLQASNEGQISCDNSQNPDSYFYLPSSSSNPPFPSDPSVPSTSCSSQPENDNTSNDDKQTVINSNVNTSNTPQT